MPERIQRQRLHRYGRVAERPGRTVHALEGGDGAVRDTRRVDRVLTSGALAREDGAGSRNGNGARGAGAARQTVRGKGVGRTRLRRTEKKRKGEPELTFGFFEQ